MSTYKLFITVTLAVALMTACSRPSSESPKAQLDKLQEQKRQIELKIRELEKQVQGATPAEQKRTVAVNVQEIRPSSFKNYVKFQGVIESDKYAQVSPKMGGVVTKITVKEGDHVTAGQVLAELDNSLLLAQLADVQASLDFAKTVYEKQKKVWEQKAGSELQYLQAKNNMETLGKKVATLNEQLDMMKIHAPFAGVVDAVIPKVGESVSPGVGAFKVVSLSNLTVKSDVSESYLGSIQKGDPAHLFFPDMNQKIDAKITTVSEAVDPKNRTFTVRIALPGSLKNIRPNMISVVTINNITRSNALTVPINTVQKFEDKNFVYVIEESNGKTIARKRYVQTGLSSDGQMEIISGLQPGDKLVTVGFQDLADGDLVKVM